MENLQAKQERDIYPKKAIKALTDEEYKKTSAKKRKDTKKGKQFSDQPKSIAKKVKKYRAESSKPHSVTISRSSNPEKKLMAVFEDSEGKKMKTTHFGQRAQAITPSMAIRKEWNATLSDMEADLKQARRKIGKTRLPQVHFQDGFCGTNPVLNPLLTITNGDLG